MSFRYLLDTNVLSESLRATPDRAVLDRLVGAADVSATAAPVWHELEFGRHRLASSKRRRAINHVIEAMSGITILPYDAAAARWHAIQRARLTSLGKPPPFVDGQIAAIAAVHDLILVTRNVRDFSGFTGLDVESWFAD